MKDMSVKELEEGMKLVINSDAVDLIGKMAITNTWNELLRRFAELEKRLNIVCQVKATDKVGFDFEILDKIDRLEAANEDLKCCGNCLNYIHNTDDDSYCYINGYDTWANRFCKHWQSDGLTRKEREEK